jgi:DNA-binding beta-propeller fold protein YncE
MAVHRATRRLYLTTTARLMALDLATGKVAWQDSYGGHCCDRPAISPDGRTIYAPAFGRPRWHVIDAAGGRLITSIDVAGWPRQTAYSQDGSRAYLAAWESKVIAVADATQHKIVREAGPFSDFVCPFAVNRRATLAFTGVDRLVGFEVADLQTGLVLDRVVVDAVDAAGASQYECPSHGIALTPDERELWLADGVTNRLHVFDATTYPPQASGRVRLRSQPRWITLTGDGTYAYAATEIIDVAKRAVVGALRDEGGNPVRSDVAAVIER